MQKNLHAVFFMVFGQGAYVRNHSSKDRHLPYKTYGESVGAVVLVA